MVAKGLDDNGAIALTVSQSRLLLMNTSVRAVDVTQPEVVMAKVVSPRDIVLTGHKPGSAQLVIWDDRGNSQTIEITVAADLRALRAELTKVLPNVHVEVSMANTDIVVRGKVPSVQASDQVVQVATPYGTGKVINLMEVSGGQQVTLQVRFAEVSKTAIDALGVNFGVVGNGGFGANVVGGVEPFGVVPGVTAGTLALGVPTPGTAVTQFAQLTAGKTPFDVFVTAMKENNLLRVLAEPNLTTMSGNQASFLAGGEFPVPVPQSSGGSSPAITVDYKQYGIRLNFTPVVMGDGRIRLQVAPEVSELDPNNSISFDGFTIPALTTRNANTTVELGEGQTLAMAGLLNNRVTATNNSTPLLGSLPIIGALFRSVRYERDETELVVLVTPRLASGMNPGQVPAMTGEYWRYPTGPQLYLNADIGGPVPDKDHAPAQQPPRKFQGAYGFVPATSASTSTSTTVAGGK
jgi:pilus assembly protein CpaC